MRLDRNTTEGSEGKYWLILNRKLQEMRRGTFQELPQEIAAALKLLIDNGLIDDGGVGAPGEYFVIRLRDQYAKAALMGYAAAAHADGQEEYAKEIDALAARAGSDSPFCKRPD